MTHETEMFIHFVMTANDLIVEALKEKSKISKLDLLNRAAESLNEAERHGAPKETLKELRTLIANKFLEE